MKKQKICFNLVVLFLLIFNSCTEVNPESEDTTVLSITEIYKDPIFKEYLQENDKHLQRKNNPEKIREYISDNFLSKNEMNDIFLAFGYSSIDELNTYAINQNKRLNYLDKKYKIRNLSSIQISDLIFKGYENYNMIENQTIVSKPGNCERKLSTCRGKANSASLAMHAGCAVLDVTALPGLLCHGAALSFQYYALDECNIDYDECKGN